MELSYITDRNWQPSAANPVLANSAATSAALLMRVLDEIDYGMVLVTVSGALRYSNQLALHELQGEGPLGLNQGQVRARQSADQIQLQLALADAVRGRRRLINLGHNGSSLSVAVLPMCNSEGDEDDCGESLALLTFGKRHACETLTVDFFARSQGLTGAEARVLQALCNGAKPKEIASQCAVAISTVRSHICSIRIKTQTANIRELVDRVAVLPPITPAMKTARTH
ncbi:MAG: LuxR C-terminal-related transcriptional regulator [Rhizobacter sp.]|nr:LuxR C-terminal-related transcriptional regulator [Rhizobacter sp.]